MVKIKVKKKVNGTIIIHKLDKREQINAMELDIIMGGEVKALEPPQVKSSLIGTKMKFVIKDYMEISSYLESGISFDEFIKLIEKILEVVMNCRAYGIRVSNLEMRPEYIYYNYTLKELKMIYWPILSLAEYADERILFQQLSEYYVCKSGEEVFKNKYIAYFDSRRKFDLYNFEKVVADLKKQYEDFNRHEPVSGTPPVPGGGSYDIYERTVNLTYPTLIHAATNAALEIKKSPFVIGRSYECDYVIRDNHYIGRRHAIIELEGGQTYITDNHSVNGITIDGKPISVGQKVQLIPGKIVGIGNEEFIFYAPAAKRMG